MKLKSAAHVNTAKVCDRFRFRMDTKHGQESAEEASVV